MRTLTKKLSRKLAAPKWNGIDQFLKPIDVAVIDPTTGLTVVLQYDPDTMDTPIVDDKGNGAWGQEIQGQADHGIQSGTSGVIF